MRKPIISMALTSMLLLSSAFSGATVAFAENTYVQVDSQVQTAVEKELSATAGYVMNTVSDRILAEDYTTMSYNDYIQAMLALKGGAENQQVVQILSDYLKVDNNPIFNGGTSSADSLAMAAAILFLNETGQNPADFDGQNLVTAMYDTYMAETDANPYAFQYVNAAARQSLQDAEKLAALAEKVEQDAMSYYVSDQSGTGIDYWGVSVDNNAVVLSALKQIAAEDEEVAAKIQAAMDWSMTQCDDSGAVVSWGSINPDSTGQGLRLFAEYGDLENAEVLYHGTAQFKSRETEGAYTYGGVDSAFATVDMLWGLLAYDRALDGYWVFDTSAAIEEAEKEQEEETTTEESTTEETTQEETSAEETTATSEGTTAVEETTAEETTVEGTKEAAGVDTGDSAPVVVLAAMLLMSASVVAFGKREA